MISTSASSLTQYIATPDALGVYGALSATPGRVRRERWGDYQPGSAPPQVDALLVEGQLQAEDVYWPEPGHSWREHGPKRPAYCRALFREDHAAVQLAEPRLLWDLPRGTPRVRPRRDAKRSNQGMGGEKLGDDHHKHHDHHDDSGGDSGR